MFRREYILCFSCVGVVVRLISRPILVLSWSRCTAPFLEGLNRWPQNRLEVSILVAGRKKWKMEIFNC